jgi:hypothetical protein
MKLLDIQPEYLNKEIFLKINSNKYLRKKYINKYFSVGGASTVCTLDIVDNLYKNENEINMDELCEKFNKSTKIKFVFLRYCDISSWFCDITKIWGPDIEAEYIVDILTNDGKYNNIEFLSVPKNFNLSKIKKVDIIAYSSNLYDSNFISNVINIWKPKILLHLSDEWGEKEKRTDYINNCFSKVKLVYRQYSHPNIPEYSDERKFNVKILPIGYHNWGKKYKRDNILPIKNRKYIWCYSGSNKGNREELMTKISNIKPYFNKKTNAFETTEMFSNSKFAICPIGNINVECYRNYESVYNGCIPIIVCDDKNKIDIYKNQFEITLPFYFATSISEVINIIKNTNEIELQKVQEDCLNWCKNISKIIRTNIINVI